MVIIGLGRCWYCVSPCHWVSKRRGDAQLIRLQLRGHMAPQYLQDQNHRQKMVDVLHYSYSTLYASKQTAIPSGRRGRLLSQFRDQAEAGFYCRNLDLLTSIFRN
jgi:hypothetical protein